FSDYSEIKIRLKFALDAPAPNFAPDWNKPPTEPMLVAIRSVDGKRAPKMMKWGAHSSLGQRRQAPILDLQRTCRGFRDHALLSRCVELGPALPCRHEWLLRVEETRLQGQRETALWDRHGRSRRNGHGRAVGELEVAEERAGFKLHH